MAEFGTWVAADEHKPDPGVVVITAIYGTDLIVREKGESLEEAIERIFSGPGRVSTGFVDDEGHWNTADGWPEIVEPTYWMEMPEPPENPRKRKEEHE